MLQVEVTQAQENLPELIEAAAHGEEVVITRAAAPVAKLIATQLTQQVSSKFSSDDLARASEDFTAGLPPSPLVKNGRLQYGIAAGKIELREDFDEPLAEFAEYQ